MRNAKFWQAQREYDTKKTRETQEDFSVEIYENLEIQTWIDNGKFILRIYKGKSGKPIAYYYYKSDEYRSKSIENYKKSADSTKQYRLERAEARKNVKNVYKINDILCSTWGYDQTNVDFYEVVGLTNKSVKLVKIGQKMVENVGSLSEYVVPDRKYRGEKTITRRVGLSDGVSVSDVSYAYKWGGEPILQTHYH